MGAWTCAGCARENPLGTKFCGHCGLAHADSARALSDVLPELGLAAGAADERRLITALFADISGYTALADRVDPEHLVEIVDPVLRQMSLVVERYQGRVVKYAGDAVLAFFGAPVAHEDDALRAVLCARDMHREVANMLPSLPAEAWQLTLHIGVNTGHVVTGYRPGQVDYSVLGDAVNVAQRLEASAGAGETYVGERTRQLVGDRVSFASVGSLALKGKTEPVRAWRVADAPVATETAQTARALVGRDDERATVAAMLHAVVAGEPRTLAIVGEPGVGKTRLLEFAADIASGIGALWLTARCVSYGGALPYRPFTELLRSLAGIRSDMSPPEAVSALRALTHQAGAPEALPYLCHLLGGGDWAAEGEEPIPDTIRRSPSAMRHHIQDAVVSVILGLATSAPVVLAVEDVHWIDEASLELSDLLARRRSELPFGIVLTARPEAAELAARIDPSIADMVSLDRLALGHIAELAAQLLDGPVCDDVVELLEARTQGNALFIREILRALSDSGGLERPGDRWRLTSQHQPDVPATVEALLSARIDRLPREPSEVLQAAALIGRRVNVDLLRATLDVDDAVLDTSLKLLVEHGFLVETQPPGGRRLHFSHALVVDVAYGRLVRRRRRHLHRRVAEAGVALYGDGDEFIDILAHHAYHGAMGVDGRDFVLRAARRAAAMFANAEAIEHLRHALEMTEDTPGRAAERSKLLIELGLLLEHVGAFDEALDVYTNAQQAEADPDASIGRVRVLITQGRSDEARAALEESEARFADAPSDVAGRFAVERARYLGLVGSYADASCALEAALKLLQESHASVRANAQLTLAAYLDPQGRAAEGVEHAVQAVSVLEEHGDLARLATALRVAGALLGTVDRLDESIAMLSRALDVARQSGHAEEEGASLVNLGVAYQKATRFDESVSVLRDALSAFERIGLSRGVAAAYCNLADVLGEMQRWDESLAAASAGLAAAEAIGHSFWITGALLGISTALLRQGRWDEAHAAAQRSLTVSAETGLTPRLASARRCVYAAQHRMHVQPTEEEFAAVQDGDGGTAPKQRA